MKKPKITKLSHMEVSEISLCGIPASTGANVHLFKSGLLRGEAYVAALEKLKNVDNGPEVFEKAISEAEDAITNALNDGGILKDEIENKLATAVYALAKAVEEISAKPGDADLSKSATEFPVWLVSEVVKSKEDPTMSNTKKTKADPEGTGKIVNPEHINPADDVGKVKSDGSKVEVGEVGKSADGDIIMKRADLDAIVKTATAAATAPLVEEIAKMREASEKRDRDELAKSLSHGVAGVTAEDVSLVLKALANSPEALENYKKTLEAGRTKTSEVTKVFGASGEIANGPASDDFAKQVENRVAKSVSDGKAMTTAEAQAAIFAEDATAYSRYRASLPR